MTETARLADYVLPAPSQYEKWEATFFNFEFPAQRLPPAPAAPARARRRPARAGDPRPAGRGARARDRRRPRPAAGRRQPRAGPQFADAFFAATAANPTLGALAPVVLYRTLGPTLPGRSGGRRRPVGGGPPLRPCQLPEGGAPGRLRRRGTGARRAAVRGRSWPARRACVHRSTSTRTAGGGSGTDGRPLPPRHPRAARRAGRAGASRPRPTPPGRSCCRPASGARSRPTRSSATRPGASGTPAARCGSARPTPSASASPTAAGPA